ncbi:MAG: hydroxylamine reductase [Desulfovibrio sp.]|nr:hydroxylamine reductase [Desulfovibrio sp.]
MFCFQCEQTAGGEACSGLRGVCGKTAENAVMQDALTGALIALARVAVTSAPSKKVNAIVLDALFSTLTNVNFSDDSIGRKLEAVRREASALGAGPAYDMQALWGADDDVRTLKTLILLGVRGIAAYLYHASVLGYDSGDAHAFIYRALAALAENDAELLPLALEAGKVNLEVMELLDKANTETYGTPAPAKVSLDVEPGPFVVVSGHDLRDLKLLLEQTEGKGVNVYTHGEMLPAHAYPELRRHAHLKGNFGTAWQNQQKEFDGIPAAVLFTTNCLMPPKAGYGDRVFTTAAVDYPGLAHIDEDKDFSPVIDKARALGGYGGKRSFTGINGGSSVMTGFARGTVMSVAGKVIEAVKAGAIKHFFLVGGCDGGKPGRNYYTNFVKRTPGDTVVLTLGCGKYRFNDLDLGEIGGLPRIMDMGQCNDAYSAIKVAVALAEAFGCGVNDLPLTLVLSWYEQKAVSILLTLLHLGVRNILLGPSLPAFVSPNTLKFLVENCGIAGITTPEQDLKKIVKQ